MLPKDMYKLMLKEYIKPIFKAKGFKTKGNVFVKETDDIVHIVILQPDTWNTKDENRFTIDLKVTSKEYIKAIGEPLPNNWFSEHNIYYVPLIENYLAHLKPLPLKSQYAIRENSDIKIVVEEVMKDLEEVVFSYLDKLYSIEGIIEELNNLSFRGNFSSKKMTLFYLLNDIEMAQKEFLNCLEHLKRLNKPHFELRIKKIAERLGLEISIETE